MPSTATPVSAHASARRRAATTLTLMAAAAVLAACGKSAPPAGAGGPGGAMPPMPVTVRAVQQQVVPLTVEAVGQAEGSKEVEVRARVTGLLERIAYAEGDRVKAGTALFAIERAPFENALATARAALQQAQAQFEQAQREARRLKPLAEQQAVAQREADDAATALRNAEANVSAAQARVRDAELNLSYTQVTAPIAGVTGRAEKSQGSLVSPTDGLLTKVVQTDPIWVRFAFSESELVQLKAGGVKAAQVQLQGSDGQALAGKPMVGKLNFAATQVDARTGAVGLRAEFGNPETTVLPGQFVKAVVQVGERKAWLVPQSAVFTSEQGKIVWTVRDGKATPTPVQVGNWVGADWAVLGGLKDGDQVITDNLLKLRPGAPVQPKAPAAAASGAPASAAAR